MKRTLSLITLVIICCAMMVSCKSAKSNEPTPEEIEAQKVALADSVLAKIDAIAEQMFDNNSKTFRIKTMVLTEKEKTIKPAYLLDLSVADKCVTKSQKINALAMYIVDYSVRVIYDMPLEEAKAVIIKLAAEVSNSFDVEAYMNENTLSGKLKRVYEKCKENGELTFFWQYCYATAIESGYVIANNPELFYNKITEEQWQNYIAGYVCITNAVNELAKDDEEISQIMEFVNNNKIVVSAEERSQVHQSIESSKQFRIANKDKYIARRNAMLQ